MKVKEAYYDNLEQLNIAFPDKQLLSMGDVGKFLGITARTAKKRYSFKDCYIAKATLARELS